MKIARCMETNKQRTWTFPSRLWISLNKQNLLKRKAEKSIVFISGSHTKCTFKVHLILFFLFYKIIFKPWLNEFASWRKSMQVFDLRPTCVSYGHPFESIWVEFRLFAFHLAEFKFVLKSTQVFHRFFTQHKSTQVDRKSYVYACNLPILLHWKNLTIMHRIEVLFPWNWTKLWKLVFPTFFHCISKIFPYYGTSPVFAVVAWTCEPTSEWVLASHRKSVRKFWGQFNKETTSVVFLQLQSAHVNFRLITDWIQQNTIVSTSWRLPTGTCKDL